MKSVKFFFLLGTLISLAVSPVFGESLPANEYPSYQDGILTIPCVDTPEHPCMFQDVKFQYTEQGGWQLPEGKAAGRCPFTYMNIDTVETIVTDTFPVQVFLKVKGSFPYMGPVMGRIPQRFEDNRFYVYMYATGSGGFPMAENFEKIIPLSVYGLSAGTYEYRLDGGFVPNSPPPGRSLKTIVGSFVLTRDNKF